MIETQDDPVAEYLKAKAQQQAPASDPVAEYLAAKPQPISAARQSAKAYAAGPTTGEELGVDDTSTIGRAASQFGSFAGHAILHPINTAADLVSAPFKSLNTAMAPGSQQDVAELNYFGKAGKGGGVGVLPYRSSDIVTPGERGAAIAQTLTNAAAPGIAGGITSRLAGAGARKGLATLAGLMTAGGASGAAYNPNDPAAGALVGAAAAPVAGKIGGSVARTASRLVPEAIGGEASRLATGARSGTSEGKALAAAGKVYGQTGVDVPATATAIEQTKPLYDKAYSYGEIKSPETLALLDKLQEYPVVQRAWKRGQALKSLKHLDDDTGEGATPGGMTGNEQVDALVAQGVPREKALASVAPGSVIGPTVEDLDYLKRGLDAEIEASQGSKKAISRTEAGALQHHLGTLLGMVDAEVPDYAAARANFGQAATIRPVQDLLARKAETSGSGPRAVAALGGSSTIGRDVGASLLHSRYGLINTARDIGGKIGLGGGLPPEVADVLSNQLDLKGIEQAAMLRRTAADAVARARARTRLASLIGLRAAGQPPTP